jgi:hypothetical protein
MKQTLSYSTCTASSEKEIDRCQMFCEKRVAWIEKVRRLKKVFGSKAWKTSTVRLCLRRNLLARWSTQCRYAIRCSSSFPPLPARRVSGVHKHWTVAYLPKVCKFSFYLWSLATIYPISQRNNVINNYHNKSQTPSYLYTSIGQDLSSKLG